MNECQHDPAFTTDGRCSKCYPRKRVVMVQHIDKTIEIDQTAYAHTLRGLQNVMDGSAFTAHQCGADCGLSIADVMDIEARCDETANYTEDNR
jgi:hypothetical protein